VDVVTIANSRRFVEEILRERCGIYLQMSAADGTAQMPYNEPESWLGCGDWGQEERLWLFVLPYTTPPRISLIVW
jgi:hypothetical protein